MREKREVMVRIDEREQGRNFVVRGKRKLVKKLKKQLDSRVYEVIIKKRSHEATHKNKNSF
ncbi:MAG: hypothetical protein MR304_09905 [Eubacterium sp.]|nr:hypothetical protein [Eubacterium sp.]